MHERFRLKPESEAMLTLDFLRFLAAVGVVVEHYWQALRGHEGLPGGAHLDFLSLCVDVFFIISGFVIGSIYDGRVDTRRGYFGFIRKRLARLAPLHWATLAFFAAIGAALLLFGRTSNFPDIYDWHCFMPEALFAHAFNVCTNSSFNAPSWSISAEMALYLIFPALLLLARRQPSLLIAISFVTLAIMYRGAGGLYGDEHDGWTNWTVDFGAVRGLAGFAFGLALYAYRDRLCRFRGALPLLVLAVSGFIAMGLAQIPPMALAPLAYAIAFFAIVTDLSGASAPFRRLAPLGQLTYSIYMLHVPLRFLLVVLVGERLLNLHGATYAWWSVFTALAVIPASWVSLIVFERPSRRWMSGAQPKTLSAESSPVEALPQLSVGEQRTA
ncbi:MAG TPA: acyltransferase [Stellaceae bacterium]|jgi:peptidoglycan/LPS O-acetylase OafA/YrhL